MTRVHTGKGTIDLFGQSFKDNSDKNSGNSDMIQLMARVS